MLEPVETKSRRVLGATELTLLAPIKRGLIPALDARSYESRARLALATLHALGVSRREIDPTPAISDVADSIRSIRSFRLSIVGMERRQVLLSVSFDGGWEPYMRRIWHPLGPLLDLIFCNCEGYLLSSTHSFPAYANWVRQAQVTTEFYYEDSPLTVSDLHELSGRVGEPVPPAASGDAYLQGRAALVALYRLADMYPWLPASNEDGQTLLRAARLLLGELSDVVGTAPPEGLLRTPTERAAWRWFTSELTEGYKGPKEAKAEAPKVQAGILERYPHLAHGCLALVELDTARGVVVLHDHLRRLILGADAPPFKLTGPLFANLAFTYTGLKVAGVDAGTLQQMPQEFREGMEARAGLLGDWLNNHPSRWTLPGAYGGGTQRVELSRVHALVQFSLAGDAVAEWQPLDSDDKQALRTAVSELDQALAKVDPALEDAPAGRVLAVQPMQRFPDQGSPGSGGHFAFADGLSQPTLSDGTDKVERGDLLLGYTNTLHDPGLRGRLWNDSTFVVVRKLRQYVDRFEKLGEADRDYLIGRAKDGTPLAKDATGNKFDYSSDLEGAKCPLHSHVRRANPRRKGPDDRNPPRILRHGMSYGPRYDKSNGDEERGVMFMAYNASIAEQFEVIQGWLAGGNSSGAGSYSALRDPLIGVARPGDSRGYPQNGGQTRLPADEPLVTLEWGMYAFVPSLPALDELRKLAAEAVEEDGVIDESDATTEEKRLALQRKQDRRNRREAALAARGSALIARLQLEEQALGVDAAVASWKIALEDIGSRMSGTSQAVWTAVRKVHGGVLRTPYGVLVCSKTQVRQVFDNAKGDYTVTGYNTRLAKSFGEIFLGRDDGAAYRAEAEPANKAVMAVSMQEAFDLAFGKTRDVVRRFTGGLPAGGEITVDVKDLVDEVLADLCVDWFGLPDEDHLVERGGWQWAPGNEAPRCPGHFHAPSRYTFQPQPGDEARRAGQDHGKLLKTQVLEFVKRVRPDSDPTLKGIIGKQLFDAIGDDDLLARTLIGVMMGFLPTVDGNLRGVMYEWVRDRSLWDYQGELRAPPLNSAETALESALRVLLEPLQRTMQLRPVPEVVWRTGLREHVLGSGPSAVTVRPGDTVAVSIVSAMQEDLLAERPVAVEVKSGDVFAGILSKLHDLPIEISNQAEAAARARSVGSAGHGKPGAESEKRSSPAERSDPFIGFGGDRKRESYPTHACPGFDMAIGVMLGFLSGLLSTENLRPATSLMALRLSPQSNRPLHRS